MFKQMKEFCMFLTRAVAAIAGFVLLIFMAEGGRTVYARIKSEPVKAQEEPQRVSAATALQYAARQTGVNLLYLRVLAQKESSGNPDRLTDAVSVQSRIERQRGETLAEWRLRGSAIGLLGVVPHWHAKRCKMSIGDFFDPIKNAICGATHFKSCLERKHKDKPSNTEKLRRAYACYHGAGDDAAQYADDALRVLAQLAIEDGVL